METYLRLFEEAVRKQAALVGPTKALEQAKRAGLGVSRNGQIISCVGDPQLILLRLIRFFTEHGNLMALEQCTPLIDELERRAAEAAQPVSE